MALSADTPRTYASGFEPNFVDLPCKSNVTIYEGSAVGEDSSNGTYCPLVGGSNFVGFAHQQVINPTSGSKRVKVRQKGVIRIAVTGASAVTNNGVAVYASDDGTFTLTSTTTNTQIGKVQNWVVSTTCDVYFEGLTVRSI